MSILKLISTTNDNVQDINESKLKVIGKFIREEFPFILDVSDIVVSKQYAHVYLNVNSDNFCELFNPNTEKNLILSLQEECSTFVRSILNLDLQFLIHFSFFPLQNTTEIEDFLNYRETSKRLS